MSFQPISLATKGILSGTSTFIKRHILPLDLKLETETIKLNLEAPEKITLNLESVEPVTLNLESVELIKLNLQSPETIKLHLKLCEE